ncbi:MAG: urea ABC transporter permease subunit UrtB [Burkholderiales bacterium]|nr:urea ABC transporter permease subunit UrtB [Burkholderiales bacterium]
MRLRFALAVLLALAAVRPALALDAAAVEKLAFGDAEERSAALRVLVAEGDPRAAPFLAALAEGEVQTAGKRVLVVKGDAATDAVTGEAVSPLPAEREDVIANNRLRREIGAALASLKLVSPDPRVRLAAAKELAQGADPAALPLIEKAAAKESDPGIRSLLEFSLAALELASPDREKRLHAVRTLGAANSAAARAMLAGLLERGSGGEFREPDGDVRAEASRSLRSVESRLAWGERLGVLFTGASLGSILMLAALGLAITYGLMGVINMAHGELIMIGAYATYVVQNLFRAYAPAAFDWYLLAAIPVAFAAAALVGLLLERTVIRWLYGRPLETLLATWGASLILIQAVRSLFGAQNVQVENPAWMSGGIQALPNLVLPWNRIVIIVFAFAVLGMIALLLNRTRLGLFVRAVTQNRPMASCVGVPTGRIDAWAFALGAGIAGLAGAALSQIGNVGPDLGQGYIVDSFMVVVVGGVGQLAGTVYAGLGLGLVNKLLEGWSGAVLAKITVLVLIIVFIQKRPQGLFALKGRAVEA